jgi:hypothetical protein
MVGLRAKVRSQPRLDLSAHRNNHVVVILADEPAALLLDEVKLETGALGKHGLNVPNARLPNRMKWLDKVFGNEPDALIRIWHKPG